MWTRDLLPPDRIFNAKSNPWIPYLILSTKAVFHKKSTPSLHHYLQYLHRSYILFSIFISFLYHRKLPFEYWLYLSYISVPKPYIFPISKKLKLYHFYISENLYKNILADRIFPIKNGGSFPPHATSHIYYFPLHNLLCRNPDIIHKPNPLH